MLRRRINLDPAGGAVVHVGEETSVDSRPVGCIRSRTNHNCMSSSSKSSTSLIGHDVLLQPPLKPNNLSCQLFILLFISQLNLLLVRLLPFQLQLKLIKTFTSNYLRFLLLSLNSVLQNAFFLFPSMSLLLLLWRFIVLITSPLYKSLQLLLQLDLLLPHGHLLSVKCLSFIFHKRPLSATLVLQLLLLLAQYQSSARHDFLHSRQALRLVSQFARQLLVLMSLVLIMLSFLESLYLLLQLVLLLQQGVYLLTQGLALSRGLITPGLLLTFQLLCLLRLFFLTSVKGLPRCAKSSNLVD
jgi:hypothetical protein